MTAVVSWPIYSSDDHLDLWALPPDVWSSRAPAALAGELPRVEVRDGSEWWVAGDVPVSPRGEGAARRLSVIRRIDEDNDEARISTPALRLQDMDRDGVFASVIYGPAGFARALATPEAKTAYYRAWNDYAVEFSAAAPDRLAVLAVLPIESPEAAAEELERVATLGVRGAMLDAFSIDYRQPEWECVWAAAGDTGLPISFHLAGGTSRLDGRAQGWEWAAHRAAIQLQLDEPLAAMIMSGALERNPGMTLVLAECGAGWFAYFLNRMDEAVDNRLEKLRAEGFSLKQKPSDVFRQQVMISFEQEKNGSILLPLVGTDRFMWGSDYPHLDSTWPNSATAIADAVGGLSEHDRRLVTADNCRRVYGFGAATA
jgi:uncharacterized protein